MSSGYSGTPLARKLSLKPGLRIWWDGMPHSVQEEIRRDGLELTLLDRPEAPIDCAHIFVRGRVEMERKLAALRPLLSSAGFIWVSWPKKASKRPTDISENAIRDFVLPHTDMVDIKVCAIDSIWSGLKLVVRRERR